MGVTKQSPAGTDGVSFLAVGKAAGADTVPVAVNIGSEERAMQVKGVALASNGTVIEVVALARMEASGFTWATTGTNLLFDSENAISLEVPEITGVSWFASLQIEFCAL